MKCHSYVSMNNVHTVVFECESKLEFNNGIGNIFKLFPITTDIKLDTQCYTYGKLKALLRLDSNHNTGNTFNIEYYSNTYNIKITVPYYYVDYKFIDKFIRTDSRHLTDLELENIDSDINEALDFTIDRHNFIKGNAVVYTKHCYCIDSTAIEEMLNYFIN